MGTTIAIASSIFGVYAQNKALEAQGRANLQTARNMITSMNYSLQNLEQERRDVFEATVQELEKTQLQGRRLTASVEERARRRYDEMKEKGYAVDYEELKKEIADRDKQDSEREISPLRQAEDAILLDTTALSIDAVVARIMELSE